MRRDTLSIHLTEEEAVAVCDVLREVLVRGHDGTVAAALGKLTEALAVRAPRKP